jgi:hypothetical protein
VSDDTSSLFTVIHDINAGILLTLVSLHILAVLFYQFRRKQDLIGPMFSGRKPIELMDARPPGTGNPWLAALLFGASSLLVYFVVTFSPPVALHVLGTGMPEARRGSGFGVDESGAKSSVPAQIGRP